MNCGVLYVCVEDVYIPPLSLSLSHRCPEDSKIGDKMIYASSKDAIKKQFTGLGLEFQANDRGDYDYAAWSDEVEKKA